MSTSLASQLNALKVHATSAPSQRKLASFLHEPKVASKIDIRTTYEHAKQALDHLCGMDGFLDVFHTTLLHPSKVQAQFNRALLTKDENAAVDTDLGLLLDALSPYFLLPPTHQVLEYLIRRYEIHTWNVEQILGATICYHESPVFARLVTICDLSKFPRWAFLEAVKTNNVPLLRANLAKRCFTDPSIVRFIYDAARRIGAKNPKLMALYTLLAMEVLDKSKISDQILRWVLPNVLDGLRDRTFPEHQLSSYMIATKLSSKAVLAHAARTQVVAAIAKTAPAHAQLDALLCLVSVVQAQPFETLPSDVVKHVLNYTDVPQLLRDATDAYDTRKFLTLFFAGIVAFLVEGAKSAAQSSAESTLFAILAELGPVDAAPFVAPVVVQVLKSAKAASTIKDKSAAAAVSAVLQRVLVHLSKRFAEQLDAGLHDVVDDDDDAAKAFYIEFVGRTFDGTAAAVHAPLAQSGLSLLLSLDHPSADIRLHAIKAVKAMDDSFDEIDALVRRLNDDSPAVVLQALELNVLLEKAAPLALVEAVAHAVAHRVRDPQFKHAVSALVSFATGPLLTKHANVPALTPTLLDMLLQFAPSADWLEPADETKSSVLSFDVWVQHLKKLPHPFGQALAAPKDVASVAQAWGKALTDDLVETVVAWTSPAPFRHVRLPYLALQVLFHGQKKHFRSQFLSLARAEWTLLNTSLVKVDLAAHRPAILHTVEMICGVMTTQSADADATVVYDDALHLLLHSAPRFFTLVQSSLSDKLAKHNWTTLLHSLCRVATRADTQPAAAVRSLTLFSVMLECHGSNSIKLNDLHQVLATLLVSLYTSDATVRKAAVHALKPLAKASVEKHDKAALATYHKAIAALTQAKTELVMDGNHLATLVATLLDDQKLDVSWAKHVLTTVLVKDFPSAVQLRALKVLAVFANVQLPTLWESTVGWFTHRLPLFAANATETEAGVLNHLLTHFLTSWATIKVPKAIVDAVVQTLATTSGASGLQRHVAATMPASWFAGLGSATQTTIVTALVALMGSGEDLSEISSHLVPRLRVSADIVAKLLHHQKSARWVADVTCVLEVLPAWLPQYSAAELENLLTPLQLVVAHFSQDKVSEYSVQMVLTVLHQACRLLPPASASTPTNKHTASTTMSHAKVLVELTMEVVEVTTSPQTRNAALLLVSALVDLYPAQVLTSLVPILSHASHLHMDEYSFHVLREIVQHAVPYVAKPSSPISIQQFLQTFVDAFASIPAARRLDLFHVVLASLELQNANALGMTIALLLLTTPEEEADAPRHHHADFCHNLAELFAPEAQMQALVFLVNSTSHLQDGDDDSVSAASVLKVADLSETAVESATSAWLSFVPHHLERKRLHAQILDKRHGDSATLQEAYLLLAQALLLYLRRGSDDALSAYALDGMHNLQRLLTAPGFVAVIGELLHHEDSVIRRRALQLLNERIEAHQDSLTTEEELLFVDMLADLTEVLADVDSALVSDLQMALLSVDVLTRFFAKKHPATFKAILPTVIGCTTHANGHVAGSAFVCLSNLALALGPAVFPYVPKFFPTLLSALEAVATSTASDKVDEANTLQSCGMVALRNLTAKLPQFLATYLPRMLALLFQPSLHPQVQVAAQATLLSLAHGMELRNLLPALIELYPTCCRHGDDSLIQLFELVATIVSGMDRAAVKTHLSGWMRFFLMAMDVRRTHPSLSTDVEDKLRHAIVQLVLKLSEKQLKPLFLKFVAWVDVVLPGQQGPSLPRQAVFYRLVTQLSAQLRSIFVPYFAHILPQCAAVVAWGPSLGSSANDDEDEDGFFKRPAKKQKVSAVADDGSLKAAVAEYVVQALVGCFSHDSDGFMDKEKFDEIMPGLVDLLDVADTQPALVSHAVTALAQLAWAAKSDMLWKPMHHRILMKTRSDSAGVRLAALRAIEQCYSVVGEEFLAMLPESIPFLAELLEDTDSGVETLCHQVIKQIEDISGESLDQYLTA